MMMKRNNFEGVGNNSVVQEAFVYCESSHVDDHDDEKHKFGLLLRQRRPARRIRLHSQEIVQHYAEEPQSQ